MAMNNKGKHARVSHACVSNRYTQKWCVHFACVLVAYLKAALNYAINYAIFSGLIYIVLPGFKGEKPLKCCLTGNLNVKE